MPILISGFLLSTILIVVGMAIGLCMRRGEHPTVVDGQREMHQARLIASRLQKLTQDVTSIVDEHRSQIDQALGRLAESGNLDDKPLSELVADVVGNVVSANQSLHSRLTSAEDRLQEQAEEIEAQMSLSLTDSLTGLVNRRGFDEQLQSRLTARRKQKETFSVLLLDLDHFKQVNDQYGHRVGDSMLVAVGGTLRGALREADTVARYGGEEFAILMPHTTLEEGIVVAHKLNAAVASTGIAEGEDLLAVTVSGGLAMVTPTEDGESLMERADAALYAAKEAGRNGAFLHNGMECCPIPGLPPMPSRSDHEFTHSASQAAIEAELNTLTGVPYSGDEETAEEEAAEHDFTDEVISSDLDELCSEMQRYLAMRRLKEDQAVSASEQAV